MKVSQILLVCVVLAIAHSCMGNDCGGQCTVDADCDGTICTNCMGGQCGSGCAAQCIIDNDCRDSNCRYCFQGYCGNSPMRACNQTCQINTDCDQRSDCALCIGSVCTAGCGQQCLNSSECVGTTGCNVCILGICAADSAKCGSNCETDLECAQNTNCNLCLAGQCGAGCGQPCNADSQCVTNGCEYCSNGVCRAEPSGKTCGQHCAVDTDCNGVMGECNQCYFNQCWSTCSNPCKKSSDCAVKGCVNCNMTSGMCSP
jgi:hypothetical protein